jgi:hypothetical protein
MAILLKQSTASQEVPLGYFLDSGDGNTEETGLTIANTDIKLWKNGATTLANKNSGGATHISNGIYYAVLDATDTNTLGPLVIFCHVSGALAIRVECLVLAANVYDSLVAASDRLQIHTAEISNDLITAAVIATGAIDADAFASNAITGSAIAADAIGSSELAASAVSEIATAVNAEVVDALTVDVIADSVASDGSRPTIAQALLMILRFLTEKSVSGTTVTVKKEDGSTSSMTFTLDNGTNPTSITRAS